MRRLQVAVCFVGVLGLVGFVWLAERPAFAMGTEASSVYLLQPSVTPSGQPDLNLYKSIDVAKVRVIRQVRIRSEPGVSAKGVETIIRTAKVGEEFIIRVSVEWVEADGYSWVPVVVDGGNAWIAQEGFLEEFMEPTNVRVSQEEVEAVLASELPEGAVDIQAMNGQICAVDVNGDAISCWEWGNNSRAGAWLDAQFTAGYRLEKDETGENILFVNNIPHKVLAPKENYRFVFLDLKDWKQQFGVFPYEANEPGNLPILVTGVYLGFDHVEIPTAFDDLTVIAGMNRVYLLVPNQHGEFIKVRVNSWDGGPIPEVMAIAWGFGGLKVVAMPEIAAAVKPFQVLTIGIENYSYAVPEEIPFNTEDQQFINEVTAYIFGYYRTISDISWLVQPEIVSEGWHDVAEGRFFVFYNFNSE